MEEEIVRAELIVQELKERTTELGFDWTVYPEGEYPFAELEPYNVRVKINNRRTLLTPEDYR